MSATDYAAFSSAAYKEYSIKDLKDRKRYVRQDLNEWGVGPEWEMMEDVYLSNDIVTTFVRKPTANQPRQIVIALRGTDIYNANDLAADVDIATNMNIAGRLKRRVEYAKRLQGMLTGEVPIGTHPDGTPIQIPKHFVHKEDIIFTGHSLGGAIAAAAAQQIDGKAIVYNMGSSPTEWLNSLSPLGRSFERRDHDNVLHFTTNRVKDVVGDPISASSYFKEDAPGSGIQTISYKLPASKQREAGLMMGHSIDLFRRDPNSSDYNETAGHDTVYNTAIRDLGQSYSTKASDDGVSGPVERKYNNPDLASAAEAGRQERIRLQKEAEERARIAAEKAAEEAERRNYQKAHFWGGIIGMALFGLATVLTGGAAALAAGAAAAITIGTTVADDIENGDRKSTGELIMDGIGVVGAAVGSALVARSASQVGRLGYMALAGGDNLIEDGIQIGTRVADSGLNSGESLLNAGENVGSHVSEVQMTEFAEEQRLADVAETLRGEEPIDVTDYDIENPRPSSSDTDPWRDGLRQRRPFSQRGNPQEGFWDENRITGQGPERNTTPEGVDYMGYDAEDIRQAPIVQNRSMKLTGTGIGGGGAAITAGSTVIGRKRRLEDIQDNRAANVPPPPTPRPMPPPPAPRPPGDKHGGSGTTPSHTPGTHMDQDEMMRFVSDESVQERHAVERSDNNTEDIDDAPTHKLTFMHKSLMSGKGVDITTQIPMVTAARGNYLRHLAQVSAMY